MTCPDCLQEHADDEPCEGTTGLCVRRGATARERDERINAERLGDEKLVALARKYANARYDKDPNLLSHDQGIACAKGFRAGYRAAELAACRAHDEGDGAVKALRAADRKLLDIVGWMLLDVEQMSSGNAVHTRRRLLAYLNTFKATLERRATASTATATTATPAGEEK